MLLQSSFKSVFCELLHTSGWCVFFVLVGAVVCSAGFLGVVGVLLQFVFGFFGFFLVLVFCFLGGGFWLVLACGCCVCADLRVRGSLE